MRLLAILVVQVLAFSVSAEEKGEAFDMMKKKALENLSARTEVLTKAKACIESATEMAQLKECRKELRNVMEDLHEERKEMRKNR